MGPTSDPMEMGSPVGKRSRKGFGNGQSDRFPHRTARRLRCTASGNGLGHMDGAYHAGNPSPFPHHLGKSLERGLDIFTSAGGTLSRCPSPCHSRTARCRQPPSASADPGRLPRRHPQMPLLPSGEPTSVKQSPSPDAIGLSAFLRYRFPRPLPLPSQRPPLESTGPDAIREKQVILHENSLLFPACSGNGAFFQNT